ncbi:hypothetical protein Y900_025890 [Mycolicibacterium aromaticivorans JS19b1 = JCM 16368]|uniref:Uncharacterized protein n=2 Tax=Mycolicibacterium aromaticivorans TaxID=318425 RepID=A0A064CTZ0_9MYCO|nr:hypothetical protein Y900_025890 [Mycolicibacterium aromaticivorans JS19b1 = JCM 16368]
MRWPYSVRMSAGPDTVTGVGTSQPRRAVIDRAWRMIGPGVEVLSGDDGGPLRRTVKRIIDPLVLRLRSNPAYSAPFVDADVAAEIADVIGGHADRLRWAAAWFELMKQERRRLRITTGNAQDLYFPVCFELSVTDGAPGGNGLDTASAALRAVHDDRDRTAVEVLNAHVASPQVMARLSAQLHRSWADVRADDSIGGPFLAGLATVLGPAEGHRAAVARQRVWSALIADATPHNLGARARSQPSALPWSLVDLGLTAALPLGPPPLTGGPERDRPLDRSVVDRVRATLRRALDRDELPDVPLLCAEEVDRACAPWGFLGEDNQAALVAGIEVAGQLAPLDERAATTYQVAAIIQARLRKEAYVLHARRVLAGADPVHPRQRRVVEDLMCFAQPYLSRLWARLHGRDVWQEPCDDVDDLRALLEGVARSVSLDHRQRIKAMLEVQVLQ